MLRKYMPNVFALCADILLVCSLILVIWSSTFANRPGPTTYYSHFAGLVLSTSLVFQSFQFLLLTTRKVGTPAKKWLDACTWAYWLTVTLSGLICTVAYGFIPKADCIGIEILAFLVGIACLLVLKHRQVWPASLRKNKRPFFQRSSFAAEEQRGNNDPDGQAQPVEEEISTKPSLLPETRPLHVGSAQDAKRRESSGHIGRNRGILILKTINRALKVIHWIFLVLFMAGSITLALQYRFTNPGTIVKVVLPSGQTQSLNYNCTLTPSNGTVLPTVWFEGDPAHGVADFLGVQTALLAHGRNSCSYDPPNFGWSDRLPSNLSDIADYLPALWDKLGVRDEHRILAGWGDGTEPAVRHAIANPDTTRGLVLMDTSPPGIEFLDAQRQNNWTESQMVNYRTSTLSSRAQLAQLILALGIPWGLTPIFIPNNSTGYYDPSLYNRYRAQGLKEDLWAAQYYFLLQQAAASPHPSPNSLDSTSAIINATMAVPSQTQVYAIMTFNASTDEAGDDFYRTLKLDFAREVAGGKNLSTPVVWCDTPDCSLSFPVNMPKWTADALLSLGI